MVAGSTGNAVVAAAAVAAEAGVLCSEVDGNA